MPSAIFLLIYALAVARVVRLITTDKVTEPIRNKFIRAMDLRRGEDNAWSYFVLCPWCVSFWVALPAAVGIWFWGESPWMLIPALALAFSYITGYLAQFGE